MNREQVSAVGIIDTFRDLDDDDEEEGETDGEEFDGIPGHSWSNSPPDHTQLPPPSSTNSKNNAVPAPAATPAPAPYHNSQNSKSAPQTTRGPISTELASTHLRRITPRHLDLLAKPVVAFLLASQGDIPTPFVVRSRFTFGQCMAGLLQTASRRAWLVTDDDDHPTAAITLTDIIRAFIST
ncbi:hypothetical protein BJ085DRAFT_30257 [Dimargaris cristalligena]|uniref:CBS domain-containing protein n=1 Tax=Dimargaris cristalligena TaxID=215637 RepID=A0A4Q0A1W0_9FUNG|nr:hypothetical protein BJ085DRAFT_30257 [Dimargaris cristalligena]|eukprot:RKP39461.1 hypothetical protein BJ085DRAFT_30257 [Dimargaris cristalligena]